MTSGIKPLPEQCWLRSKLSYAITRPQWVNTHRPEQNSLTISNAFCWINLALKLKFHLSLFLGGWLTIISSVDLGKNLASNRCQAICLSNSGPRSTMPYNVTKTQWVNQTIPYNNKSWHDNTYIHIPDPHSCLKIRLFISFMAIYITIHP